MNIYHRIWEAFTVWMIEHNKFDYSQLSDAELLARFRTYRQGWPWVDANLRVAIKHLKSLTS